MVMPLVATTIYMLTLFRIRPVISTYAQRCLYEQYCDDAWYDQQQQATDINVSTTIASNYIGKFVGRGDGGVQNRLTPSGPRILGERAPGGCGEANELHWANYIDHQRVLLDIVSMLHIIQMNDTTDIIVAIAIDKPPPQRLAYTPPHALRLPLQDPRYVQSDSTGGVRGNGLGAVVADRPGQEGEHRPDAHARHGATEQTLAPGAEATPDTAVYAQRGDR